MTALALAPAAFVAGILMFLAPCTLPIVPGYLAFISGVSSEASAKGSRYKVTYNALAFVLGFSLIFIVLGLFAGSIGAALGSYRYLLSRAAGLVLILFGATMLGGRVPYLSREFHVRLPKWVSLGRPESSFLIGSLFALGWSPCIGPILGSILFIASSSATAAGGALLLAIFSLGLALPFLICALLIERLSGGFPRLAAFLSSLQMAGGVVLIVVGGLILFNLMGFFVQWIYTVFGFLHYDMLLNYL